MIPLRRIVAEKRLAFLTVAVSVAAVAGLHLLAVYPLRLGAAQTRQREAASVEALATAQRSYQATRAMMGKIETASEQLERFYTEILPPDLASARGITYARLAAFSTEHNLRIERRNGSSDYEEESDLVRLRVTMLLTGEWPDIRAFIAAVEEASEFIVIQEVVLRQTEEKAAALGLALTVSTYYQPDAEPDRS